METIPLGVLVDRKVIRATLAGRAAFENLDLYRRGAPCSVCFFSFADLDLPRHAVNAYVFNARGRLVRRRVALPPVIHYRAVASGGTDEQLAHRLARLRGKHIFNDPEVPGKWNHYCRLRTDSELSQHIPETRRYNGKRSLTDLLSRHQAVILKRIWGSLGVGILRVRRTKTGFVWERGTGVSHPCRTIAGVARGLRSQTRDDKYIVQQALDLARCRGKRFDLRCAVQRGGSGEWHFVGASARLAGANRIATNVARGGEGLKAMTVMRAVFGADADKRMADVRRLALLTAKALGRHEHRLADLGLDLAFTVDGRLWFIEANTRQMRFSFRNTRQWPEYRTCYRLPMEYGCSLVHSNHVTEVATQPVDTQPVGTQPVDTQSADAQPVDVQPVDAQPVDAQPVDVQPKPNPKGVSR